MSRANPTASASQPRLQSGQRRNVFRLRASVSVVVVRQNDAKQPARVVDVGPGGMHLVSDSAPEYGESVTIVVKLESHERWLFLPGRVRWFSGRGFGVAFEDLPQACAIGLADWLDSLAA